MADEYRHGTRTTAVAENGDGSLRLFMPHLQSVGGGGVAIPVWREPWELARHRARPFRPGYFHPSGNQDEAAGVIDKLTSMAVEYSVSADESLRFGGVSLAEVSSVGVSFP